MASINPEDTIAILKPSSTSAFAALGLSHNKSRVIGQSFSSPPQERGKRQKTPDISDAKESQLVLSLSGGPIDPLLGFTFGSDEDKCDVLLTDKTSEDGISRVHFCIDFNWDSGALLITDSSSHGTRLKSIVTGSPVLLVKQKLPIVSGDTIQAGLALFTLTIPTRTKSQQQAFHETWLKCCRERQKAIPRITGLSITQPDVATYMDPRKVSLLGFLGSGSYGAVYKAVDATGVFHAVKVFKPGVNPAAAEKSKSDFLREIDTLKNAKHSHIVSVFDDKEVMGLADPHFVMEFIEMGTLQQLQKLASQDIVLMACQVLEATLYLHINGYAHRDIKPANILVKSTDPPIFVLSDFGFTSRDPLRTFCGSHMYAAPEIYTGQEYTSAVDIWAIGVVIIEYVSGLPECPEPWDHEEWFKRLAILKCPLLDNISQSLTQLANTMLHEIPDCRPLAQVCLTDANGILRNQSSSKFLGKRKHGDTSAIRTLRLPNCVQQISTLDLQNWVCRDNEKIPPVAINLTKICFALSLSRDVMRAYLKREKQAFYAITVGQEQRQKHIYRGTYASMACAAAFVRKHRPDLKDLLKELDRLSDADGAPMTTLPEVFSLDNPPMGPVREIEQADTSGQLAGGNSFIDPNAAYNASSFLAGIGDCTDENFWGGLTATDDVEQQM